MICSRNTVIFLAYDEEWFMLRDVQNQYGSNLPTPFFLDFEKPHGFLAYALLIEARI